MRKLNSALSILLALSLLAFGQVALADSSNGKSKGRALGQSKNIGVGNASDGISGRVVTGRDIFYTGDPLSIGLQFPRGSELITSGEVDAYVVVFSPTVDATTNSTEDSSDDSSDDSTSDSSDDSTDSSSDDSSTGDSTDDSTSDSSSASTDDSSTTESTGTDAVLSDATVLPVSNEASADNTQLFAIDAVDVSVLPAGTYQLGLILTNPGGDPLNINDWYNGLLGLIHVVGLTVTDEAVDFDADMDGEVDDDSDGDGFSDDDSDNGSDAVSDDSSDDSADDSNSDSTSDSADDSGSDSSDSTDSDSSDSGSTDANTTETTDSTS